MATQQQIDPALKQTLAQCSVSTKATARILMPEHFYAPFYEPHYEICRLIDDDAIQKVNIRASRGMGKTSLVAKALAGRCTLFRKKRYIVYVTTSETLAVQKTENLKRELLRNKTIRGLFGSIKTSDYKWADMDESFTKTSWVANGHTLVFARGCGQQIRGLLFDHFRPDLIIIDDLQDMETIGNEQKRQKDWEWLRGDVEKAISQYDKNWKIVHIDTVKHQDGVSERLASLPDWQTITLPLCDEHYKSLCPEFVGDEELAADVASHRAAGTLDVFYREVMCQPMASETAAFKREYFKYYDEMDRDFRKIARSLDNVVLIDPARTENPESAESAIVGVGIDLEGGAIYVRDVISARISPDKLQDEAFGMARRLDARAIGIEVTGLGAFARYPFETEMRRQGHFFQLVDLHAKKGVQERGKIERIKALIPFYRRGMVYHNPSCCGGLEAQLMSFPSSKFWDIMDALAYVVEVMDDSERFFRGPNSLLRDDDSKVVESEYAHLERDDRKEPALPDWRVI